MKIEKLSQMFITTFRLIVTSRITKVILSRIPSIINAPIFLLIVTLIVGNYYLPKILTETQFRYSEKRDQEQEKYKYSVELQEIAWKRLFLAKNYYWNYINGTNSEHQNSLWEEYYDSTEIWNFRLVSIIFGIEKNYGRETRDYFNNEVNINMIRLHEELLNIRNSSEVNTLRIEELFELLDNRMYVLAEKINL